MVYGRVFARIKWLGFPSIWAQEALAAYMKVLVNTPMHKSLAFFLGESTALLIEKILMVTGPYSFIFMAFHAPRDPDGEPG